MKRVLCLLCLVLLFAGCAAQSAPEQPGSEEPPLTLPDGQASEFRLTQDEYTSEVLDDDGTLLLTTAWTLPRLVLTDAGGTPIERGDTTLTPAEQRGLAVCDAFNAEMTQLLTQLREFEVDLEDMARSDIALRRELADSGQGFGEFISYVDELSLVHTYQTGTLVSVCTMTYSSTGGAHPNTAFQTWNFDLTSGRFLTYEDFAADEPTFRAAVSGEIMRQIFAQGLEENYYDDYATYVENLAYASVYFSEEGMTVLFDEYTIGPHAAGTPTFFVSAGLFADLLSERGLALLTLPEEAFLLADFFHARELWACFHTKTLPLDETSTVDADGMRCYRVDYPGVATMGDLRALLCTCLSGEVADAWLANGPYREADGVLCCAAERVPGGGGVPGSEEYAVERSDGGGEVVVTRTQTYHDAASGTDRTDESEHRFPFVLQEGSAVFTAFDGIW